MQIIDLSPRAYIRIDRNGSYSVHKRYTRGELYCGFKPRLGDTASLERALRYVGATAAEAAKALTRASTQCRGELQPGHEA